MMGWIRHHAIIVTAFDNSIRELHLKAKEIFPVVGGILSIGMNGYATFCVPPDGSKEGWTTSNEFDDMRDVFIAYLQDEATPLCRWVEVAYGECESRVTRSNSE